METPTDKKRKLLDMDINGTWTGIVIYGKEYQEHENKELFFDVEINQTENNFSGISIDTGGIGMSPDKATINGTIDKGEIEFIKQYETRHYYKRGKTIIDKTKKGPNIQYTGSFDSEDQSFKGKWLITMKMKFLFFIPIRIINTGTWLMKRK